jgi:glyoxylase-like metal-dependent hydrolase (beta-lactamase superfamily II)
MTRQTLVGWRTSRHPLPRWVLTCGCVAVVVATQAVAGQQRATTWPPAIPTGNDGQIHTLPVRGQVSMLVGAGGNITVQAGGDGIILVDSGSAAAAERVWAAVQAISRRPLRYIINTTERADYSGGNEVLARKGSSIPFRPPEDVRVSDGRVGVEKANVIAYLTVFHRMSAPTGKVAARPEEAWPDNTYSSRQKKLYFNDEPVVIQHVPTTTDGTSIVHFRGADVISVGEMLDLTSYPRIDVAAGGSLDALVQGLYRVIEITVPNRKSEAGTLVIPGKGRLADQPDVVYYQQMLAIIRDRIQDLIGKGMTVEQVKAARPTRDYDPRYGTTTGAWTTDLFVEAAYASLKK